MLWSALKEAVLHIEPQTRLAGIVVRPMESRSIAEVNAGQRKKQVAELAAAHSP